MLILKQNTNKQKKHKHYDDEHDVLIFIIMMIIFHHYQIPIGTCPVLLGPAPLTPFIKRFDAFSFNSDHNDITALDTMMNKLKTHLKKGWDAKLWMELSEHTVRVPVVKVERPDDDDKYNSRDNSANQFVLVSIEHNHCINVDTCWYNQKPEFIIWVHSISNPLVDENFLPLGWKTTMTCTRSQTHLY